MCTEKLDSVRSILEDHNSKVPPAGQVNIDQFFEDLKLIGGTSDDRLSSLSFEEIADLLPGVQVGGIAATRKPIGIAKAIALVFRGKTADSNNSNSPNKRKVKDMLLRELLQVYALTIKESGVLDPTNEVVKRLKELSKDKKCIVIINGEVDIETSLSLINEVMRGFGERDTVSVARSSYHVSKVGEAVEEYGPENPIFANESLRPFDESCTTTGYSWKDVPLWTRKIIRLAVEAGEITKSQVNMQYLCNILDRDSAPSLDKLFPKASAKYNELERVGGLPTLTIRVRPISTANTGNSGFPVGKKVL